MKSKIAGPAVCYTFAVYCTVPLDPEDGLPMVTAKDLEAQLLKAFAGHYRSPIDAECDLELMGTEPVTTVNAGRPLYVKGMA
jgi:hypothetical protein